MGAPIAGAAVPSRAPPPVREVGVGRRGIRGLRAAVLGALPLGCSAALSISSGYEEFLSWVRQRFVCEAEDLVDRHLQEAPPCDSLRDGPFCRGLPPLVSGFGRHRPEAVDSVIPHHLFGDPEQKAHLPLRQRATVVLEHFLGLVTKDLIPSPQPPAVEGRLDFSRLPISTAAGSMPVSYSRGLPRGVMASWAGAWQITALPRAASSAGLPFPFHQRAAVGGRSVAAALRLNGAVGSLSFSEPVVLRRLLVRPALHAVNGNHRLNVRARRFGDDVWRNAHEFDAAAGPLSQPSCGVGDIVLLQGPRERDRAVTILEARSLQATVWLPGGEHADREVPWGNLTTPAGVSCAGSSGEWQEGWRAMTQSPRPSSSPHPSSFSSLSSSSSSSSPSSSSSSLWRDLARRVEAVDEITFSVPEGSEGWLLKDLVVAKLREPERSGEGEMERAEETSPATSSSSVPPSPDAFIAVRVLPGAFPIIARASMAAVLYSADDLLRLGLHVRDATKLPPKAAPPSSPPAAPAAAAVASAPRLAGYRRSVESLRQFVVALVRADTPPRLPPHVRFDSVLADFMRLVRAIDVKEVKKYMRFSNVFAHHWDVLTQMDNLVVAHERWIRDPDVQASVENVFHVGQTWKGTYFCMQGLTSLHLDITEVSGEKMQNIQADLTFELSDREIRGTYAVAGKLELETHSLEFRPLPHSWRERPAGFVEVGLVGRVSWEAGNSFSFAGSVPASGCDSFSLAATAKVDVPVGRRDAAVPEVPAAVLERLRTWQSAMARTLQAFDRQREQWRAALQESAREIEGVQAVARAIEDLPGAAHRIMKLSTLGGGLHFGLDDIIALLT